MKAWTWILWTVALVSVILFALGRVALPVSLLLLLIAILRPWPFRPPDNHIGVVYRLGRFHRVMGPNEWILLFCLIDRIKPPIDLRPRPVEVTLSDVLTRDGVPVRIELPVYYQRDLRLADGDSLPTLLRIPDAGWDSLVGTMLREVANEAIGGFTCSQVLTPAGRVQLKQRLSETLAQRVGCLGIFVNPRFGVNVSTLKPAEVVWQAMEDRLAAAPQGEAALIRLLPILEELCRRGTGTGLEALLLQLASATTKTGAAPQVLLSPEGAQPYFMPQAGGQPRTGGRPAGGGAVQTPGTEPGTDSSKVVPIDPGGAAARPRMWRSGRARPD